MPPRCFSYSVQGVIFILCDVRIITKKVYRSLQQIKYHIHTTIISFHQSVALQVVSSSTRPVYVRCKWWSQLCLQTPGQLTAPIHRQTTKSDKSVTNLYELPTIGNIILIVRRNFSNGRWNPVRSFRTSKIKWPRSMRSTLETSHHLDAYLTVHHPEPETNDDKCNGRMIHLTHWGRDKMGVISQTTFSNVFSWMNVFVVRFEYH